MVNKMENAVKTDSDKSDTIFSKISCLYSIKDIKQPRYFTPYDAVNDQVAMRHFQNMAKIPNSIFSTNPTDFELWKVGEFDEASGVLASSGALYICRADDLLDNDQ